MDDDLGALFDGPSAVAPAEPVEQLLGRLGGGTLASVKGSSLSARGRLLELREQLLRIERTAHDRRLAIERAFVTAGVEDGSDQIRTSAGIVKLELPSGQYETRPQALHDALLALVPSGNISTEEVNDACPVTISYTVNHSKLNTLYRHRGDAVREAIDAHRTKLPPDRRSARPVFPKPKEK